MVVNEYYLDENKRPYYGENFNDFLRKLLDNYNIDNLYVSFRSDIYVTDINPNNSYRTPTGVYTYPLFSFKDEIRPDMSEEEFRSIFPYKNNEKYIIFFHYEKDGRLLDQNTPISQLKGYVSRIKEENHNNEKIVALCDKFLNGKYMSYYNSRPYHPTHNFWLLIYDIATLMPREGSVQTRITNICNKLNIVGFADYYGKGFIHGNEPNQAVFFRFKSIGKIFVYHNTGRKIKPHIDTSSDNNYNKTKNNIKKLYYQHHDRFDNSGIAKLFKYIKDDDEFLLYLIKNISENFIYNYSKVLINSIFNNFNNINDAIKVFFEEKYINLNESTETTFLFQLFSYINQTNKTEYNNIKYYVIDRIFYKYSKTKIPDNIFDEIFDLNSAEISNINKLLSIASKYENGDINISRLISFHKINLKYSDAVEIINALNLFFNNKNSFNSNSEIIQNTLRYILRTDNINFDALKLFISNTYDNTDNKQEFVNTFFNILHKKLFFNSYYLPYDIFEWFSDYVGTDKINNTPPKISATLMFKYKNNDIYKIINPKIISTYDIDTINDIVKYLLKNDITEGSKNMLKYILKYGVKKINATNRENIIKLCGNSDNINNFFQKHRPSYSYY